jgi:hypothetical protein
MGGKVIKNEEFDVLDHFPEVGKTINILYVSTEETPCL